MLASDDMIHDITLPEITTTHPGITHTLHHTIIGTHPDITAATTTIEITTIATITGAGITDITLVTTIETITQNHAILPVLLLVQVQA
jgi:hypothetical protein